MNDEQRRKYYQRGCSLLSREYPINSGPGKKSYFQQKQRSESHVEGSTSKLDVLIDSKENEELTSARKQPNVLTKQVLFRDTKLHPSLLKALQNLRYITVNQIQMELLTYFSEYIRVSLQICAPRKSGKTTAVFLCVLNELLNDVEKKHNQALILCPTLELAEMCYLYCQQLIKFGPLKICLAVKGKNFNKKEQFSENIIIATPGKASSMITSLDLKKFHYLFIDDADCLKNPKSHLKSVAEIFKKMSSRCRIIVTIDSESPIIDDFFKENVALHHVIKIEKKTDYKSIKQLYVVYKNMDEKLDILDHFASTRLCPGQLVIFCETTDVVDQLEELLQAKNFKAKKLYGGLPPIKRNEVLKQFENQEIEILITTQAFLHVISTDHIAKVINFEQLFQKEGLLIKEYEKRKFLLNEKSDGIFVNLIDERYKNFFFYEKKTEQNGKTFYGDAEIITMEELSIF